MIGLILAHCGSCAVWLMCCVPDAISSPPQGANITNTDWTDVVLRKDQQVRCVSLAAGLRSHAPCALHTLVFSTACSQQGDLSPACKLRCAACVLHVLAV